MLWVMALVGAFFAGAAWQKHGNDAAIRRAIEEHDKEEYSKLVDRMLNEP
jgi:hypothetical protein